MDEQDRIRREFYQYQRNEENETLGQFLATFHSRWMKASTYGVTGAAAIMHLIPQLPPDWQSWGVTLVPQYMDITFIGETLYGDCGGFIGTFSQQFFSTGAPPPGPHQMPEVQLPGFDMPFENTVPFVFQPFEPEPYTLPYATHDLSSEFGFEFSTDISEPFSKIPTEVVPYDPYPYVVLVPDPSYPQFHDFMNEYPYPPTKEDEAGPSRPAGDGDGDEETASSATGDGGPTQEAEEGDDEEAN